MIYPQNFEQKIGFDQIRSLIKEKCLSTLGIDYTDRMTFSTGYESIREQLNQTWEFVRILENADDFPADFFFDVRPSIKRVRIEGTFLEETELFDLRRSLDTIQRIIRFLYPGEEEEIKYPYLYNLSKEISSFPDLIKRIDLILDKFGHIKDNASPQLAHIRSNISSTLSGISRSLNAILRTAQSEGFVDKEVSPTMRDGRLVIPVAPSYKRKIRGIVHDESASGKTIFIEPAEVVEANNRVRELENEERREITRILTSFTDELRPAIDEIIYSYEFLAEIDFIRAKALFAEEIGGVLPTFENTRANRMVSRRTPLALPIVETTRENNRTTRFDVRRKEQNTAHLRPECRGKISLSQNRRAFTIYVAMRTVGSHARQFPNRHIQGYIYRYRRRAIHRRRFKYI